VKEYKYMAAAVYHQTLTDLAKWYLKISCRNSELKMEYRHCGTLFQVWASDKVL